jgi:hypothetical protein
VAAPNPKDSLLARQARERFTAHATSVLPELARTLKDRLAALVDLPGSTREMQDRRDAWLAFPPNSAIWVSSTARAWLKAQQQSIAGPSGRTLLDSGKFELMDNEVMESKILASRLALRLLDFASWELNDLRLRIQTLESVAELGKDDIFRPEVLAQHLVEQWGKASLTREMWMLVQDSIQKIMAEHLLESYHAANEFLVGQGVMAEIDLRPLVKRTPSGAGGDKGPRSQPGQAGPSERGGASGSGPASMPGGPGTVPGGSPGSVPGRPTGYNTQDETRMQTATTPLARARMKAQGVMGHLKRLLTDQGAGFDETRPTQASPQLAQAMATVQAAEATSERTLLADAPGQVYEAAHVEQAATVLRQRSSSLKQAASSSSEKATIEIVALMFQSILAEDRIPPTIRVWFARLQMPVLRVAISEPEFFGSLQHPARRLIDRMGSCVLGFDVAVTGGAMEVEIKRVVQVIEQYPETGRRVFQLVYDEFQKFLSKFLTEQGSAARVVSVAQQVEQKETMAIQYTIEMRSMLNDMPVREEIREFLFKIWAEVLAIAAMRNGPQHQDTVTLKRAAADLVWAASAKPAAVAAPGHGAARHAVAGAGPAPENHQRHAGRCLHVEDRCDLDGAHRRHGQAAGQSGRLPVRRGRR